MVVNERPRYCKILTQPAETSGRGIELGRYFPYQMQLEQVQEGKVQSGIQYCWIESSLLVSICLVGNMRLTSCPYCRNGSQIRLRLVLL